MTDTQPAVNSNELLGVALEENRLLRNVLRDAHTNLDALFHHGQLTPEQFEMLRKVEKPIADTLYRLEGIPVVSEHTLRKGTDICDKCGLPDMAGLWEQHLCNDEWRQVITTNR